MVEGGDGGGTGYGLTQVALKMEQNSIVKGFGFIQAWDLIQPHNSGTGLPLWYKIDPSCILSLSSDVGIPSVGPNNQVTNSTKFFVAKIKGINDLSNVTSIKIEVVGGIADQRGAVEYWVGSRGGLSIAKSVKGINNGQLHEIKIFQNSSGDYEIVLDTYGTMYNTYGIRAWVLDTTYYEVKVVGGYDPTGKIDVTPAVQITGVHVVSPPSTSSSPGNAGDIAYNNAYMFLCIALNTWVRSPLSTF
jgi:hypothetical protein